MTQSTLKKIVVGLWLLSFGSSIPFAFFGINLHKKVILYFAYTAQGIFVVVTITAYVLIGVQLKTSTEKLRKGKSTKLTVRNKMTKKVYLVPFLIIVTFVFFYQLPQYFKVSSTLGATIKMGVTYVGLSLDPIIYIFFRKPIRRIAVSLLTSKCCSICSCLKEDEGDEHQGIVIRKITEETGV